jgi:hypothetical protein
VHHGRFVRQLQGLGQVFGVKFKAGGFYPFYRQPVAVLLNQSICANECLGPVAADLVCRVLAAPEFEAQCAVAEEFLLHHWPRVDLHVPCVSRLLERIAQDTSIVLVRAY